MQTNQYQALAMRTAKMFPTFEMNLLHAALGIGSESGELAETIAANWMDLPGAQGTANIGEETGDGSWYVALLSAHMGWNFEDLLITADMAVYALSYGLHKSSQMLSPAAMQLMLNAFAGEILTVVKAHVIYGKPLNTEHLKTQASLYLTTLAFIAEAHGLLFADVLDQNIEKLRKRFPDKYSDADALARADKA
jgi:NTP pyrophosphatase (non-canonical NTP hydrolase)